MKSNSKITIGIFAAILIFWISFLFIEQQNKTNPSETNIKITNNRNLKSTFGPSEEIKEQQELEKQKELEKKIEEEAQRIAKQKYQDRTKENKKINENTKTTQPIIIPQAYDIQNMKFYSQSPYGNRNQPYQDACEEASLLIGYYYIKGLHKSKDEYNKDLLDMVDLEKKTLGYFESTTITEMKQIINMRDPTIQASIIEHPTIRDIEREISQNHVVVAPFYGKGLKNPHYALGGPEYHFMVIKGYNQTNFIAHDVGTLKGANREYSKSTIMDNLHDRNRTDVRMGAPRILILKK